MRTTFDLDGVGFELDDAPMMDGEGIYILTVTDPAYPDTQTPIRMYVKRHELEEFVAKCRIFLIEAAK